MIKYNFELRKDKINQDGLIPIRILFRINSSVLKRNTGLSCKIQDWQNNRVKANSKKEKYYGYDEINEKLQEIESKIQDISLFFRANKIEPTKDLFIEKFDSEEEIPLSDEFDFFKCFNEYIDKGKLTKTPNTIKGQTTIKNYLEFFCKENAIVLTFDKIDDNFFEVLRDYSFETKKMKQNYFAKVIKTTADIKKDTVVDKYIKLT